MTRAAVLHRGLGVALLLSLAMHLWLVRLPLTGLASWLPWFGTTQKSAAGAFIKGALRPPASPAPPVPVSPARPGHTINTTPEPVVRPSDTANPTRSPSASQPPQALGPGASQNNAEAANREPVQARLQAGTQEGDLALADSGHAANPDLLPQQAHLEFAVRNSQFSGEGQARQSWRTSGINGSYSIALDMRDAAGIPVTQTQSDGVLFEWGLGLSEHRWVQRGIRQTINVKGGEVHGPLTGKLQDIDTLSYDLSFDLRRTLGDAVTLLESGENIAVSLTQMDDNVELEIGVQKVRTKYFVWRTPGFSTVAEIWISLDKYRLPVQVRVHHGEAWRVLTATSVTIGRSADR